MVRLYQGPLPKGTTPKQEKDFREKGISVPFNKKKREAIPEKEETISKQRSKIKLNLKGKMKSRRLLRKKKAGTLVIKTKKTNTLGSNSHFFN